MSKTGTTSMQVIFNRYRSGHDREHQLIINKVLAFYNGKINQHEFTRYVKRRDRRLGLEIDSSSINFFLLDILVREFREAKFILTIRDCYSWLDSLLNTQMLRPISKINEFRYTADKFKHVKEETVLAKNGLYTLDGYFSHWNEHNSKVLATVPEDRLFVVKTREINQNIPRIEKFLGITPGSLLQNIHANVRYKKFHILSQIDKDFLEEKANLHCQELMDKYFPEVKGFDW